METPPPFSRVLLAAPPFADLDRDRPWIEHGLWPAAWITHASRPSAPCRIALRCRLALDVPAAVRLHAAGDERYELFLDGQTLGWVSERGPVEAWPFDSYDGTLTAGGHTLVVVVSAHGEHGLLSQVSVGPAFLLAVEGADVACATGRAPWEAKILPVCEYVKPFPGDYFSVGWNTVWPGEACDADFARGGGEGWEPVRTLHPGSTAGHRTRHGAIHLLTPVRLPVATRESFRGGRIRHCSAVLAGPVRVDSALAAGETAGWSAWWRAGHALTLPAQIQQRVISRRGGPRVGTARRLAGHGGAGIFNHARGAGAGAFGLPRLGAHPHYHFYATLLGIRPDAPGFRTVRIEPCLGPLREVEATLPHPDGAVRARFTAEDGGVRGGEIDLPPGISGTLHLGREVFPLTGGKNVIGQVGS